MFSNSEDHWFFFSSVNQKLTWNRKAKSIREREREREGERDISGQQTHCAWPLYYLTNLNLWILLFLAGRTIPLTHWGSFSNNWNDLSYYFNSVFVFSFLPVWKKIRTHSYRLHREPSHQLSTESEKCNGIQEFCF